VFGFGGFVISVWNAVEAYRKKQEDRARARIDSEATLREKYAAGPQSALVRLETFYAQHGGDARRIWEAFRCMRWGLEQPQGSDEGETPTPPSAALSSRDGCNNADCDGLHGQKRLPAAKRQACREEYVELEKARHLLMAYWRNLLLMARERRLPAGMADPEDVVILRGVWLYQANRFRTVVEPLEILLNSLHGRDIGVPPYWPFDTALELKRDKRVSIFRSKLYGDIERQWLVKQWRDQCSEQMSESPAAGAVAVPVDDASPGGSAGQTMLSPPRVIKFESSLAWARQAHESFTKHGERVSKCRLPFHGPGVVKCEFPSANAMASAGLLRPAKPHQS
jgi:hypothetical protein